MDSLRFVHESPQINQTQKKRPRLVTSCDNCRLKKIKCVQNKSQDKCEACQAGNISCQFRDRERYFAERSRIVSGSTSTSSRQSSPHRAGSHDRSPSYTSMYGARRSPPGDGAWIHADSHSPAALGHRYASGSPSPYNPSTPQSLPGTWYTPEGNDQRSSYFSPPHPTVGGTRSNYSPYALPSGLPSAPPQDPPSSYRLRSDFQSDHRSSSSALVDPRRTDFPHPSLMSHFVQLFFEYHGRDFTFLQYDDIAARLYNSTLSPALANGISALASRYSQSSAVLERGVMIAIATYTNNVKHLISQNSNVSYLDTLHAIIIIAYSEYKNSIEDAFKEWRQTATKFAMNMGLGQESSTPGLSEHERNTYRRTWSAVLNLQQLELPVQARR